MSIFGNILGKIIDVASAQFAQPAGQPAAQKPAAGQAAAPAAQSAPAKPSPGAPAAQTKAAPQQANTQQQPRPAEHIDVEKVLSDLAAKKGGGGNWRTSIVDLLKLLDLDSSLAARKELGKELNVHAGADGSAEQNIALQKAVWAELAKNGGHVPASLRD